MKYQMPGHRTERRERRSACRNGRSCSRFPCHFRAFDTRVRNLPAHKAFGRCPHSTLRRATFRTLEIPAADQPPRHRSHPECSEPILLRRPGLPGNACRESCLFACYRQYSPGPERNRFRAPRIHARTTLERISRGRLHGNLGRSALRQQHRCRRKACSHPSGLYTRLLQSNIGCEVGEGRKVTLHSSWLLQFEKPKRIEFSNLAGSQKTVPIPSIPRAIPA